jgi:hypothetical protein
MLTRVEQFHQNGCFISCLAILLQVSYQEAFKLVHPKRKMPASDFDQMRRWKVGMDPEKSLQIMEENGLRVEQSNLRKVSSLRRRTSLILLRWRHEPAQMHAVVFDGSTGRIIDPSLWPSSREEIQDNLESIYHVERITQPMARPAKNTSALRRADCSLSLAV